MEDRFINELLQLKGLLLADGYCLVSACFNFKLESKLELSFFALSVEKQDKLFVELELVFFLAYFEIFVTKLLLYCLKNYLAFTCISHLEFRGVTWSLVQVASQRLCKPGSFK